MTLSTAGGRLGVGHAGVGVSHGEGLMATLVVGVSANSDEGVSPDELLKRHEYMIEGKGG